MVIHTKRRINDVEKLDAVKFKFKVEELQSFFVMVRSMVIMIMIQRNIL